MNMSPRGDGRFIVSLSVIAVLAVLVWRTMEPGKYQQFTWLLLGLFAFRIVLLRLRSRYSKEERPPQTGDASPDPASRHEALGPAGRP